MTPPRRVTWRPLVLVLLAVAFLGLMVYTGTFAPTRQLARFAAKGVLQVLPERIQRVTLSVGEHTEVFVRHPDHGWLHAHSSVPGDLQEHLNMALRLMHASGPVRIMARADYQPTPLAEFGLASPSYRLVLADQAQPLLEAHFGTFNPQDLLQYMRLAGSDDVYLMSRFVGQAWEHVWEHVHPSPVAHESQPWVQ